MGLPASQRQATEGATGRRELRMAVMGPERETPEELPFRGEVLEFSLIWQSGNAN